MLREKNLLEYEVGLDNFEQVHDIEVVVQLVDALVQVVILATGHFEPAHLSTRQTAHVVGKSKERVVREAPLVQNQVEQVVQLLSLRFVAEKLELGILSQLVDAFLLCQLKLLI